MLCAHRCGVDRLAGEHGRCQAGAESRIFSAQLEVADELELIPTFAVAFSGCDLRCAFCITGRESWNAGEGEPFIPRRIADRALNALTRGAKTVMILGGEPTVHLPAAIALIARLPDDAKIVWKTNAHATAEARELLDGLCDVWLADYKFGNDGCARRLAGVSSYGSIVQENLRWAAGHTELLVRHLAMPGHIECCWRPIAQWLAANLPGVKVNLRDGFWPAWHSRRHAELRGTVGRKESALASAVAAEYNLRLVQ
jgi:putative pyruvate formate lyase activating enzyme